MSDDLFGEALEQGVSIIKGVGQQAKQLPTAMVKTAASQVAGGASDKAGTETVGGGATPQQYQEDKDFVKDLYGGGAKKQQQIPQQNQQQGRQQQSNAQQKTPEELQKIEALKRQLHAQYFQGLNQKPKQKQEERVAEKLEKEKKEEKEVKLYEKKKKEDSIAVIRAKNKAETFRGASG